MPRLVAVLLVAAVLVAHAPAPAATAAEEAGQTSLSVDDVTISPETGASQTIRIAGNLSAPITVSYSPSPLPWPDYVVAREGVRCERTGQSLTCEGTGDLTIRYPVIYFPPASLHDTRYTVTATTPDGGYATGSLRVRFRSDFSVWAHNTGYRGPNWGASTTEFNATVQTLGPDPALNPTLRVTGLDFSLGVPAGCTLDGGAICALEADLVTVTFTVPVCTSRRPVQVSVSTTSDDPNPGNNTYTAPGLDPVVPLPQCPGDGGGSGGGGSGSGGDGAPGTIASESATPSTSVTASSSLQPATVPTNRTRTTAPDAASPAAGGNPAWGALAAGMGVGGGAVLAVLVGVFGVRQWRRRKASTDANGETWAG